MSELPAQPRRSSGRRRSGKDELVTIYWRDIPAQVKASVDGETGSWLLEERFQVAIDRAAGVAGLTNADDYVLEWRRSTQPCSGNPQVAAQTEAERLQHEYDSERVRALVNNGGCDAVNSENEPPPAGNE